MALIVVDFVVDNVDEYGMTTNITFSSGDVMVRKAALGLRTKSLEIT